MQTRNRELWAAFIAVLLITIFYLLLSIISDGFPTASSPVAHTMGIVGFILMLMTEVLYSVRKRSRRAHLGRMSSWLDFHIFTGIVGPYLVVLHGAWKFNGLAGVVTLLTILVAGSGFIGRYIFTAIPRNADDILIEAGDLESQIAAAQSEIQSPAQIAQLESLVKRRDVLERQVTALARSRRLLALWHTVHVPLGMALFTAAFIHIGAAIYYAGLFR